MTDHKYTAEQIIEALEVRMHHDKVCREAYDLINRLKFELSEEKAKGAMCADGKTKSLTRFGTTLYRNWRTLLKERTITA